MRCEVTKVVENEDGSANYHFDWDDEFEAYYCKIFGVPKIEQAHFQQTVIQSLQAMLDTEPDP